MIRVGEHTVGSGCPCFLVAEIGINHNGDMDLARKTIDAAAEAGADAVKFQNYCTEDFILDRGLTYEYLSQGSPVVESQYEMFKRCELSRATLKSLSDYCDRRGIVFFSTPTGEDGLQDLVSCGVKLLKNGSDYLGEVFLIAAMARTGIPTVLSTGMATLGEIEDAVTAFRGAGGKDLILLHCTSSYPTPPEDVHLRKIPLLAEAFGCPAGLSDHTDGVVAALGAVALGACMIEKHFTLDKHLPGPDHRFSSDPGELRHLVDAVRSLEKNFGEACIAVSPSEELARREYRLSCVAAYDLPANHRLLRSDIRFCRPGYGVPPKAVDCLEGRSLGRAVPAGKVFTKEDFL